MVIDARLAQGFTTFMLKMGVSPIADEVRRVEALGARYGSTVSLIADANQGWTAGEARQFMHAVAGSGLLFVEQTSRWSTSPTVPKSLAGARPASSASRAARTAVRCVRRSSPRSRRATQYGAT